MYVLPACVSGGLRCWLRHTCLRDQRRQLPGRYSVSLRLILCVWMTEMLAETLLPGTK